MSVSTLQRRAKEWGIGKSYATITESDLVVEVKKYLSNSAAGEVMIKGYLESKGIHMQRDGSVMLFTPSEVLHL